MLSYVSGTSDQPLLYQTVGATLERAAERWPARDALIIPQQNIRWTWRQLNDEADRLARGFLSLGLKPGDRIGIWAPNRVEWVVTQFASAKAGLILVTINPAYRLSELEAALNKVAARALVLAPSFKSSNYVEMIRQLAPELGTGGARDLKLARLPHLRSLVLMGDELVPGFIAYDSLLRDADACGDLQQLATQLQPEDPINIQFTSGTTGLPKGATLTHHNIVNNGYFVARRQRFTEHDRVCIPVPLYHCFGMGMGVLGCTTHGAAMVFPGEGFDPLAVLKAVDQERCTALYGVPTMFIAELDHPEFASYDLHSLRTGIMAGAPCPVEIMKRVVAQMHMREITICMGTTEMSPITFQTEPDDTLERRVSTVGTIHPHVEAKIVDANGRVVPLGVRGELLTRGYGLMQGYWEEPQKTAEAIDQDGWMHTGDLVILDEAGYLKVVGRSKDLIIRGGENISPREIEDFLYLHPKIQEVQVFGLPDQRLGEIVAAWIKLKPEMECTVEEVQHYCRDNISHHKVPKHVSFVTDIPMTVTGKPQKHIMRKMMVERLGLQDDRAA
ncbi:fatty-acyl-CoA synthase [Azospirillum lipoferum]|uniref:3-methylmercaptopropionyl-CoA ligase n=1 Tax=Azospirillum lipoferum TaxID=193 RepID=A0A5A9GQS6_AZOLI|nr:MULTISPECIES: AMP-binding protein [Azospirillum]KAA0595659.1 AMP-binding protein [Azospirillum lipoferum]MCP1611479.1 fatty-acyl-CoA synthase [Azospirillum lipoferum]MDW5537280.1 AMP-binding protein [Azospirillum sp. NL1]